MQKRFAILSAALAIFVILATVTSIGETPFVRSYDSWAKEKNASASRILSPSPVSVTNSGGSLVVSWTADEDTVESPFYCYKVTRKSGLESVVIAKIFERSQVSTTDDQSNLTDGVKYTYIVETIEGLGKPPNDPFSITARESADGSGTPGGDAQPPSAPTSISASASGDSSITLSWNRPPEGDVKGYKIMRAATAGGPYSEVQTITDPATLSYVDGGLGPGSYYYVITTFDEVPNYSPNSQEVASSLAGIDPPTGVTISQCPEGNALNLSWQQSGQNIDGYRVYRSTDGVNFDMAAQIADKTITKFKDHNLQDGTTYYYSITCYRASVESPRSPAVFGVPSDTLAPRAPVVYLEDHSSNGYITLKWDRVTDSDVAGIKVKRGTSSGVYDIEFDVPKDGTSYRDNTIQTGIRYYYVVCPYDEVPNMAVSNEVSGPDTAGFPPIPANVVVTVVPEGNALNISWSDGPSGVGGTLTGDAESYKVYTASASGGPYTFLADTNDKYYLHTSLADGTAYYYRISAINAKGESAQSMEVFGIPADIVPPPPPSQLSIRKEVGFALNVSWLAPSINGTNDIAGYNIYRRSADQGLVVIGSVPASRLYFNDTSVVQGKAFFYSVTSFDEVPNESPQSSEVSAIPGLPFLVAPTGLTVSMTERNVTLVWLPVEGGMSYVVYRRASYATGISKIGNTTELAFIDATALENSTYYYAVAGVDDLGTIGEKCAEVMFAVPDLDPLPPTGMYLTPSANGYLISWNPNAEGDIAGYAVYRSTSPGGPYDELAFVVWTDYEDVVSGSYYYVVKAVDTGGHRSANSEEVFTGNTYVAPPESLKINPSDNALELTWSASRTHEVSEYRIYRSEMLYIGYSLVGTVGASDGTEYHYLDRPSDRRLYYYYVTAWDSKSSKESPPSQKVSGQVMSGDPSVGTVTGLIVRDPGTGYSLILSWDACSSTGVNYYRVYCTNSTSGVLTLVGTTPNTNYTATGLRPGITYYYEVVPVNSQNIEGKSASRVSATPRDVAPPSTPQNVRVALVSSEDSATVDVIIRWSPSPDEDVAGYKLYWSNDNISFQVLTTLEKNVTSFTHRGLDRGKYYFYKVSAIDSVPNESPQSMSASLKTPSRSSPGGNPACMTYVLPAVVITLIIIAILAALATRMEGKKRTKGGSVKSAGASGGKTRV